MASYKITPLARGKFLVEVDDGGDKPSMAGPYNTEAAARAYIDEHKRMTKAVIAGCRRSSDER